MGFQAGVGCMLEYIIKDYTRINIYLFNKVHVVVFLKDPLNLTLVFLW